jgi:tRNA_anti-like
MTQSTNKKSLITWLHLFFGGALLITFFLPWVSWNGHLVTGSAMATGDFFAISEANFKLANPFPKLSFTFYAFWLIPVLAAITIAFVLLKRRTVPFSYIAGAMSLALFVVYFLFTKTLIDLGVGKDVFTMLKPAAYLNVLAAVGIIITSVSPKSLLPKIFWLLTGPVIAYAGYKFGEKYIMSETFGDSKDVKADYTLTADDLIREFMGNDTATNRKYLDKMLVVTGKASAIELKEDSTSTISFADSTGSYAIFSLEKNQYERVKTIKQGDAVSLKGVCSGSIFSEILGTTAITFKRATFNSTK